MAKGYYKELKKLLVKAGYKQKGSFKGSHQRWVHDESGQVLQVPFNLKSRHTANGILAETDIDHKF